MSPTDMIGWRQLAGELYDQVIIPLAENGELGGRSYFPLSADRTASTYFTCCDPRATMISVFGTASDSATDIVSAVASYWSGEEEPELEAISQQLRSISEALVGEVALSDGTVDVLCYTLF